MYDDKVYSQLRGRFGACEISTWNYWIIWSWIRVILSLHSELRNKRYYGERRKKNKSHIVLDNANILKIIESLLFWCSFIFLYR